MTDTARRRVLEGGGWLTALQIAELAGFQGNHRDDKPYEWRRNRAIFAIRDGAIDYFPSYALDPDAGYQPVKSMATVLAIFDGHKSDWGIAFWFAGLNGFLGGRRPQDVLVEDPGSVIAAAKDEVAGITHG